MNRDKWKLTDEEYEFIKGEIAHIFVKYDIKCVPVSSFEIASKLGITLIPFSCLSEKKLDAAKTASEDGFLIESNGHEYIFYNDIDKDYERQNWTILHEIGHVVLDHTGHSQHDEDEANFFAKYAIAPPPIVYKTGAESMTDIYERFDITFEASYYAFCYFTSWIQHIKRGGELQEYDKQLIRLYNRTV